MKLTTPIKLHKKAKYWIGSESCLIFETLFTSKTSGHTWIYSLLLKGLTVSKELHSLSSHL